MKELPIGMSFEIKCIKNVRRSNEEDKIAFQVGRIVTVVQLEIYSLDMDDQAPYLLRTWYETKSGLMEIIEQYFSTSELGTMMSKSDFNLLFRLSEKVTGVKILSNRRNSK